MDADERRFGRAFHAACAARRDGYPTSEAQLRDVLEVMREDGAVEADVRAGLVKRMRAADTAAAPLDWDAAIAYAFGRAARAHLARLDLGSPISPASPVAPASPPSPTATPGLLITPCSPAAEPLTAAAAAPTLLTPVTPVLVAASPGSLSRRRRSGGSRRRIEVDNLLFQSVLRYAGNEADTLRWLSYYYTAYVVPRAKPAGDCVRHAPGECFTYGGGRVPGVNRHDVLRACIAHFCGADSRQMRDLLATVPPGQRRVSTRTPTFHIAFFYALHARMERGDRAGVVADLDMLRRGGGGVGAGGLRSADRGGERGKELGKVLTVVRHRCGCETCCNPDHLCLGTQTQNKKVRAR